MFKSGVLEYQGEIYRVFIVDEKNYYRMDICQRGAKFHSEPNKVLYSEYRKRKSYRYGDIKYKRYIEEIKDKLNQASIEAVYDSQWLPLKEDEPDGEMGFFMYTTRKRDDTFMMQHIEIDGVLSEETYVCQGDLYAIKTIAEVTPIQSTPVNAPQYEDITQTMLSNNKQIEVETSSYVPLYELKKRFDLSHLDDKDYSYIHSKGEARAYVKRCQKAYEEGVLVGYDIESTGLEMDWYGKDELVGIILSAYPGEARYFPFRHNKSSNLPLDYLDEFYDELIKIQSLVVAHNKKFDRKGATRINKDLRVGHDSYILSVLVNPVMKKGIHGLKQLEFERSGNKYLEFDDIFIDKSNINFADLPEDLIVAYACPDADNTRSVWIDQWKKLPKAERGIYEIECQLADLKSDQEYWGFRVDLKDLVTGQERCKETLHLLEEAIRQLSRKSDLNMSSPDVLANLLYNEMRCPVLMKTKGDKPSTSSKALEKLSKLRLDEPKHIVTQNIKDSFGKTIIKADDLNAARFPLCLLLVEYRKYLKLDTAFYNRITRGSVDSARNSGNGYARYFSWINQIVTSGRQSSPLHQLPPAIKNDILSDSPEHYLIDSDFSQIELRFIFSLAKEVALILKASNPGIDIHRAIQYIISHTPIWAISKEQRQRGKSRNFGVVYGISGRGLANNQFGAGATPEQIKQCEDAIDEFYKAFKRIAAYVKKNEATVLKYGYIHTMFYRYKYFYEIHDPEISRERKASLIRQANNLPVQGTAADVMKMAENNIQDYIREKGWDKLVKTSAGELPLVRCMLSIHDEPLVSAHRSIPVEEILEMIRVCMEIPIGNLFKRKKLKLQSVPNNAEILGMKKEIDDKEAYDRVLAMNEAKNNTMPFAPLFAASSISDTWGEGHGGDFELQRELRTRLLNEYKITKKSAFDTWEKRDIDIKDKDGNIVGTENVYGLKYQIKDAINAFLDESITSYMEGLIAKYGEEPKILEQYVRDDVLTHDLIARYSPSKDEVAVHGKYSHMELISYATAKFMKKRNGEDVGKLSSNKEKEEDTSAKQMMAEMAGLGEELVEVAPDGTYIYTEAESIDDYSTDEYETYESLPKILKSQVRYCYLLFDALIIDTEKFPSKGHVDKLLAYLWSIKDDDGFYSIRVIYAGQQLDTKMKIENVDIEVIEDKIREILGKTKEEDVC